MEKHKLDSHFKKAINESSDFYDAEAKHAKERVWNKVKTEKRSTPLLYRLLAAASILLLIFLSSSVYYNLKFKSAIDKLVETNTILKSEKEDVLNSQDVSTALSTQKVDTLYIEKKNDILKPVLTTKYIKDTVYVKQIVYLDEKEESKVKPSNEMASTSTIESKKDDKITVKNNVASNTNLEENLAIGSSPTDEISTDPTSISKPKENTNDLDAIASNSETEVVSTTYQKDIIIKSKELTQKKKKRTFKIKFGGNNSNIGTKTLALNTKISN